MAAWFAYLRQFGVANTLATLRSRVIVRLFPNAILREDATRDLSTVPGATSLDTNGMSTEYASYITDQISRSVRRSSYVNPLRSMIGSRDRIIRQLSQVAKSWSVSCERVLSIGCRDERELDTLERLLETGDVTGVDLFSASPRIRPADMHQLPFDADRFDVAVAIHSMEHSYDARRSLSEMLRVTKPGGLLAIESPVGFEVTEFDRTDLEGVILLSNRFPANTVRLLWCELENRDRLYKPPTLRAIFQKQNPV
jgi:SAM-dependent methyltransferase